MTWNFNQKVCAVQSHCANQNGRHAHCITVVLMIPERYLPIQMPKPLFSDYLKNIYVRPGLVINGHRELNK